MTHRPTRLFVIKFLGLWGGLSSNESKKDDNDPGYRHSLDPSIYKSDRTNKFEDGAQTRQNLKSNIESSSRKIVGLMVEKGIPGLTVQVSVKGRTLWKAGFGFCDVENQLACVPDAHMRIASISKALFASTVVGPMIEKNEIDLKSSVHSYLTPEEFPKQKYQDKEYDITVKQLLSHTAGITHYLEGPTSNDEVRPVCSKGSIKIYQNDDQYYRRGFYQQKVFRSVFEALEPFKDGPLLSEPGKFSYTTYGYTLLSAVAQKVHQREVKSESEQIEDFWLKTLHRDWGMNQTYLDLEEPIISNRSRYYLRSGLRGSLINAPYANSSVKWAGGGIISTTNDLIKFGNHLIDSFKGKESAKLKRETIELLWKEVTDSYGLGFYTKKLDSSYPDDTLIYHTGGALGASSIIIIYPNAEIVVAILVNLGSINLTPLATSIAEEFAQNI